ncbi:MAG TPA: hypothetical protein DC054_22455 [Blastocatellia bacterium]|nr:hypothetical protein [Blastocatellia bacterium]
MGYRSFAALAAPSPRTTLWKAGSAGILPALSAQREPFIREPIYPFNRRRRDDHFFDERDPGLKAPAKLTQSLRDTRPLSP